MIESYNAQDCAPESRYPAPVIETWAATPENIVKSWCANCPGSEPTGPDCECYAECLIDAGCVMTRRPGDAPC